MHVYLGMKIDFTKKGKGKFSMIHYINAMLEKVPDDMKGKAAIAAGKHIFVVNEDDPKKLSEEDAVMFHHNTAKLIFSAKLARPDTHLSVAFLSTRVKLPNTYDYKKLTTVLNYLRRTLGLSLILGMYNSGSIKWYIDRAFAIHDDIKAKPGK